MKFKCKNCANLAEPKITNDLEEVANQAGFCSHKCLVRFLKQTYPDYLSML